MTEGVASLPLLSALVSLTAAGYLLVRYYKTGAMIRLVFALSMITALIGQALEYHAAVFGWTDESYKLYYFASPLTPAVAGVGAPMLLSDRKWYELFAGYVAALSLVLLLLAVTAPVNRTKFGLGPLVSGEAMPKNVRMLSPLLTVPNSIAMLAGSLYSFAKDRTKVTNLLIAASAIIFALGGAMLRMGVAEAFLALELFGTLVLACAFVYSEPVTTRA